MAIGFKPNDEKQIGVFAQDVKEVIPEAVKPAPFDTEDGKSIVIVLSGLSFMDHAVTGLEPVEPVFEELNWQAKQCQITADVA